jgi:hypothetical protein
MAFSSGRLLAGAGNSIQFNSNPPEQKPKALSVPVYRIRQSDSDIRLAMERSIAEWKLELERIWSAHAPDYGEAVRLAQRIATTSQEAVLRQAASQAMPILRGAAQEAADQLTRDAARRRLGIIRDVLLTLAAPQFGKRREAMKLPAPEECHRQLLGLPLGCRLSETEIHRAYKRVAKHAHPDAGGNVEAFLKLSAARDALMKERRRNLRS